MNAFGHQIGRTRLCYGVDLHGDDLLIVRGERIKGDLAFASVDAENRQFIDDLAAGTPCASGISTRESFARWVTTPFSARAKARKVLPTLLDIELPFPLESCSYDFVSDVAPPKEGIDGSGVRALAVAARITDVQARIKELTSRGIDPMVVDHEGLALWTQSLQERPLAVGEESVLRVVIFLGSERWVVVIGRGEEFISAHHVRRGESKQIERLLGASYSDEKTVVWCYAGKAAEDREVIDGIRAELVGSYGGETLTHDNPTTFLARAFATRTLTQGELRCNLRSGSLAHEEVVRQEKVGRLCPAVAVLLAGLLLIGFNVIASWSVHHKEAKIDAQFSRTADEIAGYHITGRGKDGLASARKEAIKKASLMAPFRDAFKPSLMETIASIVDVGRKSGLRYDILAVERTMSMNTGLSGRAGGRVTISGTSPDWKASDQLLAKLRRLGFGVRLTRKEVLADERIPFAIATEAHRE